MSSHGFDAVFVITLLLAWMLKLWTQVVVYTQIIMSTVANHVSSVPSILPLEGWTFSLRQLRPFNYGCLYAHLVTDSKTIAENQRSAAATTFGVGAMKHKEVGYSCFMMTMSGVGFWPGFATGRHHIYQEVFTELMILAQLICLS